MTLNLKYLQITLLGSLFFLCPRVAFSEIIVNGDFETGDLTGWTAATQNGDGLFSASTDVFSPFSFQDTVGPASGTWYAVADQNFPGDAYALLQSFTIPGSATSVNLSYDLFVNDAFGSVEATAGLFFDPFGPETQHARVDILTASSSPFSTAGADVVSNLYLGRDPFGSNPNPYQFNAFDLTGILLPGNSYQLRFAGVNNFAPLNIGLDNVSLMTTGAAVPEPGSFAALTMVLSGFFACRRWRKRRFRQPSGE